MTTSNQTSSRTLSTLQFTTTDNYSQNLQTLRTHLHNTADDAIVVAPEVCLTDFAYDNFEEAIAFSQEALELLLLEVKNRVLIFTMLEHQGDGVFNVVKVLHQGEVIHQQSKSKLFKLGNEHHYFRSGVVNDIAVFEVDGIKIGILVCFELRFKELWIQLEGADIICVTARWGAPRSEAFRLLSSALSVVNQCYVLASDASNTECTSLSGIISPMGTDSRNGNAPCLSVAYNQKEIKRIRRYLDVGIHG